MNHSTRTARGWAALALCSMLAACGGGGDDGGTGTTTAGTGTSTGTTGGTTAAAATLTITAANPALHNTTVNLATASNSTNEARAADGFSTVPYCAVGFEAATGANGRKYSLLVYFRQTDLLPINVSLVEGAPPSWVVFDNKSGAAISGVTVSTSARTLSFNNKVLTVDGLTATLSGTVGFARHASVAACGS